LAVIDRSVFRDRHFLHVAEAYLRTESAYILIRNDMVERLDDGVFLHAHEAVLPSRIEYVLFRRTIEDHLLYLRRDLKRLHDRDTPLCSRRTAGYRLRMHDGADLRYARMIPLRKRLEGFVEHHLHGVVDRNLLSCSGTEPPCE